MSAFVFARVHMLGLRAWGDDLIVVLFEFLDERWYTIVPEPSMRVSLWSECYLLGEWRESQLCTRLALFRDMLLFLVSLRSRSFWVTSPAAVRWLPRRGCRCLETAGYVMFANTFLRSLLVVPFNVPRHLPLFPSVLCSVLICRT